MVRLAFNAVSNGIAETRARPIKVCAQSAKMCQSRTSFASASVLRATRLRHHSDCLRAGRYRDRFVSESLSLECVTLQISCMYQLNNCLEIYDMSASGQS
jgi:hypothetical protein